MIDWINFTPWPSLLGGVLLGIATSLFILLCGRILGISGIIGGLLNKYAQSQHDFFWRARFILGLLLSPIVFYNISNKAVPTIETSDAMIILSGLLVGAGTSLGSGCTSGHGICGLSRFSLRSLIATSIFMLSGIATVFLMRHI
jgi:uncharacterized membrane protein YedE/YeeE